MELLETLVNAIIYCHKGIQYRCCRVVDTLLKLVTSYKKLKNEQLYDNVNNSKKLVKQFFGGIFPRVNYPEGLFFRGYFSGPL